MKLKQSLEGWGYEKPLREMVTCTKCIRHMNDIMLDSPTQDTIPEEVNKTSQVANTRYQD